MIVDGGDLHIRVLRTTGDVDDIVGKSGGGCYGGDGVKFRVEVNLGGWWFGVSSTRFLSFWFFSILG